MTIRNYPSHDYNLITTLDGWWRVEGDGSGDGSRPLSDKDLSKGIGSVLWKFRVINQLGTSKNKYEDKDFSRPFPLEPLLENDSWLIFIPSPKECRHKIPFALPLPDFGSQCRRELPAKSRHPRHHKQKQPFHRRRFPADSHCSAGDWVAGYFCPQLHCCCQFGRHLGNYAIDADGDV